MFLHQTALTESRVVKGILVGGKAFLTERQYIILASHIRQVEVIGLRWELGRKCVHLLHRGANHPALSEGEHRGDVTPYSLGNLAITETQLLRTSQQNRTSVLQILVAAECLKLRSTAMHSVQL